MKVHQLLLHHGIKENPFGQEDAQSDQVFKRHCLEGTYHPAWDKIFGSPEEPATAVVFGEKGSGKTALRLQIVDQIARYNRAHPDARVLVVEYDDFNPFLDCFRDLCVQHQKNYYDRLCYIAADKSETMLRDVLRHGVLANHPGRFRVRQVDALQPEAVLEPV